MLKRIISGIQPTGIPHIGNYLGAINHWIHLQESEPNQSEITIMIADIHSLSNSAKSFEKSIKNRNLDMASVLLACGLDPNRIILYQQSAVGQHCELSVLLSNFVTYSKVKQIPINKVALDKDTAEDGITFGRLGYPVLQAADILLHRGTHVPVGEDQTTHIELCRHIARRFNMLTESEYFTEPEILLDSKLAKVRSLRDPSKKMSKSDTNPLSYVSLTDDDRTIRLKVSKALTDSCWPPNYQYDPVNRPAVASLLDLVAALNRCDGKGSDDPKVIASDLKGLDYGTMIITIFGVHLGES
ncbi:hypothetical protein ACOME3_004095 [Neoechinorhynchus agilis]